MVKLMVDDEVVPAIPLEYTSNYFTHKWNAVEAYLKMEVKPDSEQKTVAVFVVFDTGKGRASEFELEHFFDLNSLPDFCVSSSILLNGCGSVREGLSTIFSTALSILGAAKVTLDFDYVLEEFKIMLETKYFSSHATIPKKEFEEKNSTLFG